ncbi:MAG: heme o synthase [Anaerolineae bacterium]
MGRRGLPPAVSLGARLAGYFALTKSKQTLLLYATGICAYIVSMGGHAPHAHVLLFSAALLLSISGCTVLNMVFDRDIDAIMERTRSRPLVRGVLNARQAAVFGVVISLAGLALAFALRWQAGVVIAMGFVFDLGVYTLWLKRRSPLSIIFGGISGGMPALAGRVLAIGRVDLVGILFVLSILLWIPSHIVTLSIKYAEDYRRAEVPVWPNAYGERSARYFIAVSNLLNAVVLMACGLLLQIAWPALVLLLVSAGAMIGLAGWGIVRPSEKATWVLFKAASMYMLLSFLLITFGGIL